MILFCAFGAWAADGPDAATAKTGVPSQKDIAKEVADGVDDGVHGRAPKWTVEYTGDLNGSMQGGILTATSVSTNTSVVGAAMNADRTGKAREGIGVTLLGRDKSVAMTSLTLADGTKCRTDGRGGSPPKVDLIDADSETFHAEISGKLVCGPARDIRIDYKATLNKQP
jgi:hypothetical protein